MAYVFSTNNAPPNSFEAMFQIKTAMIAAGWTVYASGTGNHGAGSGLFGLGDLLTTSTLIANNGTWFIMKAPGAGAQPCFAFSRYRFGNAGQNGTYWAIAFDPVASFGPPASPILVPSGPTTYWFLGNGDIGQYYEWFPADATYALNICCDNTAPYKMWVCCLRFGTGAASGGLMIEEVVGAPPGDARPFIVSTFGGNTTFGDGWANGGNFGSNTWASGSFDPANPAPSLDGCPGFYWQNANGQPLANPSTSNSVMNPITGKDELYPILYARPANAGGAWQGLKGVGVMAFVAGTARSPGDTYSVSTPRDRIRLGNNLTLPWDGSVPVF